MALILTDIDDCVLSWYSEFTKWLWRERQIKSPTAPHNWQLGELLGMTESEADALVHDFNASAEFFDLKPCRDSGLMLPKLAEVHKIIGITSGSSKHMDIELTRARRAENLERYFPNVFSDLHVLPLHGDKSPHLSEYFPSIWIEDSVRNAIKGLDAGHKVFLMDEVHNRDFNNPGITRIKSWVDVAEHMEKLDV